MNHLFICSFNEKDYLDLIRQQNLPSLKLTNHIEEANIILGDPPLIAPLISKANRLQWVQSTFAGCDKLVSLAKKDYQLTNVRGIFGPLMSEYVFGQLIARQRHFSHYQEAQKHKKWSPILHYPSLLNKTICILGTGSIGQHLASTAKHFGMHTIGISHSGKRLDAFDLVMKAVELPNALAQADIVVSVLPSTTKTLGMLNRKSFSYCQNAIFFNVGRGDVLVEKDLLWAIEKGHIQHAFLDVFKQEPLAENHPFWTNKAISITPHISAISFPDAIFQIFCENYQNFTKQKTLNYLIDFDKEY